MIISKTRIMIELIDFDCYVIIYSVIYRWFISWSWLIIDQNSPTLCRSTHTVWWSLIDWNFIKSITDKKIMINMMMNSWLNRVMKMNYWWFLSFLNLLFLIISKWQVSVKSISIDLILLKSLVLILKWLRSKPES